MALAQAIKSHEAAYTINDAMDSLFVKLDEAINEVEKGKVQTGEEAWDEIDSI